MARDDTKEYWESQREILRRCAEAGLDENEIDILLHAYQAGALRSWAQAIEDAGDVEFARSLRHCASGIRPRGWRKLLPAKAVTA